MGNKKQYRPQSQPARQQQVPALTMREQLYIASFGENLRENVQRYTYIMQS